MKDWLYRLHQEKDDLDRRIEKLSFFNTSINFRGLSKEDQVLLQRQFDVMLSYSDILGERIARSTLQQNGSE